MIRERDRDGALPVTLRPDDPAPHTRISAVERRAQIITATRKVALARGLHDLRVADVAAELDVSTGLIHYHFATKHELLEAMLRDTAAEELNAVMLAIAERSSTRRRSSST